MKKIAVTLLALGLVTLPSLVFAGDVETNKGDIRLYPAVGGALPIGDEKDWSKFGPVLGGGADYFVTPKLAIGGHAEYTLLGKKKTESQFVNLETSSKILSVGAHAKYMLGFRGLYAMGGVSLNSVKFEQESLPPTGIAAGTSQDKFEESNTDFGVNFGFGCFLPVGDGMNLFGDLSCAYLFHGGGDDYTPPNGLGSPAGAVQVDEQNSVQYLTATIGLSFLIGGNK